MFAVVEIAGLQHTVKDRQLIEVNRQSQDENDLIQLDTVCLLARDGDSLLGAPYVKGASVVARVIKHKRGPKIKIIKMRRRKSSMTRMGHRQDLTELRIEKIVWPGESSLLTSDHDSTNNVNESLQNDTVVAVSSEKGVSSTASGSSSVPSKSKTGSGRKGASAEKAKSSQKASSSVAKSGGVGSTASPKKPVTKKKVVSKSKTTSSSNTKENIDSEDKKAPKSKK